MKIKHNSSYKLSPAQYIALTMQNRGLKHQSFIDSSYNAQSLQKNGHIMLGWDEYQI